MSGQRSWRAGAVVLAAAAAMAAGATSGASAGGVQMPNLAGTSWFGTLQTPAASLPVDLEILSQDNRRFMWTALVAGVPAAMGDGTISASGQGSIKGDGVPGNPVGLAEIFAHGMIEGPPGAMDADFDFHGKNVDSSMIAGMIVLSERSGEAAG
jgi:hypothetical protein